MMKKITVLAAVFVLFALSGCFKKNAVGPEKAAALERHLKSVTQLTFDGDNGEAYFSRDGRMLIFQSNRGGYACDKIWIMNTDGSDKHMVSPDHGANTCSFFFPSDETMGSASYLGLSVILRSALPSAFAV